MVGRCVRLSDAPYKMCHSLSILGSIPTSSKVFSARALMSNDLEVHCSEGSNKKKWSKYFAFMDILCRTCARKLPSNDLRAYLSGHITLSTMILRGGSTAR